MSASTLDRLMAAGEFELVRMGPRLTRITPESVDAYLERRAVA